MKKYPVIILAGGQGKRAGGILKQFVKLHKKPLIQYSLEVFLSLRECNPIVVVVPEKKLEYARKLAKHIGIPEQRLSVVTGGRNRRESALRGLDEVMKLSKGVARGHVFFHDAARPLISSRMIRQLEREAERYGAATVGVMAIDLLFKVENGFIKEAVNKEGFYYGFTPQCLPLKKIWEAHLFADASGMHHDMDNIEVLKLVRGNTRIRILDEFYPNIKMTYPGDRGLLKKLLD